MTQSTVSTHTHSEVIKHWTRRLYRIQFNIFIFSHCIAPQNEGRFEVQKNWIIHLGYL